MVPNSQTLQPPSLPPLAVIDERSAPEVPDKAPGWALALADQTATVLSVLEAIQNAQEDQGRQIAAIAAAIGKLENLDTSEIMGQMGAMFGIPGLGKN